MFVLSRMSSKSSPPPVFFSGYLPGNFRLFRQDERFFRVTSGNLPRFFSENVDFFFETKQNKVQNSNTTSKIPFGGACGGLTLTFQCNCENSNKNSGYLKTQIKNIEG